MFRQDENGFIPEENTHNIKEQGALYEEQCNVYEDQSDFYKITPPSNAVSYTWHSGGLIVQPEENIYDQAQVNDDIPKQNKKQNAASLIALCAVMSLIFGLGGGYIGSRMLAKENAVSNQSVVYQAVPQKTSAVSSSGSDGPLSVSEIAELTQNSVVEITTETVSSGARLGQYVSQGAGSGVIVTGDGYIVTNNHVIDKASKITVRLKDGRSFEAALVGTDSKTDLAVIKIDITGLQAAVLGDSSKLTVGELAVAVGNPLGQLGGTVTNGIISALDREIEIDNEKMTLLQTNAAINPGNSGGGLFNASGELIGIVNAKSSGSDVEGLGFAIPVNSVKPVMEDLINLGYVKGRLDLGMSIVDITDAQTAMMYRVSNLGVYVLSVNSGSAAQRAGFLSGDLLVSINGKSVSNYSDFNEELENHEIGETVTVTVKRNNRETGLSLVLTEYQPSGGI